MPEFCPECGKYTVAYDGDREVVRCFAWFCRYERPPKMFQGSNLDKVLADMEAFMQTEEGKEHMAKVWLEAKARADEITESMRWKGNQ